MRRPAFTASKPYDAAVDTIKSSCAGHLDFLGNEKMAGVMPGRCGVSHTLFPTQTRSNKIEYLRQYCPRL